MALLAACARAPGAQPAPAPAGEAVTTPSPQIPEAGPRAAGEPRLPPVPPREGPLALQVVYPGEGAQLTAADSNFIFGSVGSGRARLSINGQPVEVAANGAFLGFIAVPADGVYLLEAASGDSRATLRRQVRLPPSAAPPPAGTPLRVVPGSATPSGAVTALQGEPLRVSLRATAGASARLLLPDGSAIPLLEQAVASRANGFQQELAAPRASSEYAGTLPARLPLRAEGAEPALASASPPASAARVELVRGRDTLREPFPLSLAVLPAGGERLALAAGDRADSVVIGQALPGVDTPYQWFFPVGTVFTLTGERDGFVRARLTREQSVWIDARSLRLLPPGSAAPEGTVGTLRVVPQAEWVDLRLVTSARLPHRVRVEGSQLSVEVYGARTRTNWAQYGPADPLVRRLSWEQASDELFSARLELAQPVWGWKSFYTADGTLVVRVRRPPRIDPAHPLAGRFIGVDAGHPPGGAIGPTALTEAEANLAIARRLARLLREAGARVLETRPDSAAVALGARPLAAERAGVELLVSIHNNAFPDGVNPFRNQGTTAFYHAPQSQPLARALEAELVGELGLPELGIARADLALVRSTWFPSALSESMFLMIPRQENALRDPAVQERIARAHLRAITAFLRAPSP